MFSKKKLRACGLAVSIVAAASMVTTPIYAAPGQSGQRVQFHTTTAALEIVRAQNPALYQRVLAYRSGQDVRVSPKERAYLQRVDRIASAAIQQARATDFSSQSRKVSAEARQAFAQAPAEKKKTEVVVTPDPFAFWKALPGWLTGAGTALTPFFPFAAISRTGRSRHLSDRRNRRNICEAGTRDRGSETPQVTSASSSRKPRAPLRPKAGAELF